ncbi:MAG: hypothetical protein J5I81_07320 [Nitrococcus mobilis]|nr:hypothetical protein [Nitrococcus mobilis]
MEQVSIYADGKFKYRHPLGFLLLEYTSTGRREHTRRHRCRDGIGRQYGAGQRERRRQRQATGNEESTTGPGKGNDKDGKKK